MRDRKYYLALDDYEKADNYQLLKRNEERFDSQRQIHRCGG